jgi:RNA polymerase sigma-70 factor (ECF subfamily)
MNRKIIDVSVLINNLKNRDPKAETMLYNLYSRYLFNICKKLLDNVEDCHDLVSQAFSKIFQNISKAEFSNEIAFKAWIKKIQINEALYFLKKQHPKIVQEDINSYNDLTVPPVEDFLNYLDLFSLVDSLPQGYRIVFYLHQIEGYSHKEIASMLHISKGTSKSQFHKARILLQEIIKRNSNLHENN